LKTEKKCERLVFATPHLFIILLWYCVLKSNNIMPKRIYVQYYSRVIIVLLYGTYIMMFCNGAFGWWTILYYNTDTYIISRIRITVIIIKQYVQDNNRRLRSTPTTCSLVALSGLVRFLKKKNFNDGRPNT